MANTILYQNQGRFCRLGCTLADEKANHIVVDIRILQSKISTD